jgi:hypothetical protein
MELVLGATQRLGHKVGIRLGLDCRLGASLGPLEGNSEWTASGRELGMELVLGTKQGPGYELGLRKAFLDLRVVLELGLKLGDSLGLLEGDIEVTSLRCELGLDLVPGTTQ